MAIYRLPPSPFIGGRQPLDNRDFNPAVGETPPTVDDPIPKFSIPVLTAILFAWQPVSVPLQAQRFVPVVEEQQVPPNRHLEIYNSWIPEVASIQPRIFTPQEVAVVDDPIPTSYRGSIIANNWREELKFIQLKSFVPTLSIVEEFVPHARPQLAITIAPYRPILQRKLVPEEAAAVNDPPFGQRIWLKQVLDAWIPPPFDFIYPVQFIEEPAQVDDPPIGRRIFWLTIVLEAWRPPPPEPWNPILHITPPTSDDIIIWMWKRVS